MADNRGYRNCVRVIITQKDKVLLGLKKYKDGRMIHVFPGGGVEGDDSVEDTVIKECLEEVGVLVTNVTSLNLTHRHDVDNSFFNSSRAKHYKGIDNKWYTCKFVKYDKREFNVEGDGIEFSWVTVDAAIAAISNDDPSIFTTGRLEALDKFKEIHHLQNKSITTEHHKVVYNW